MAMEINLDPICKTLAGDVEICIRELNLDDEIEISQAIEVSQIQDKEFDKGYERSNPELFKQQLVDDTFAAKAFLVAQAKLADGSKFVIGYLNLYIPKQENKDTLYSSIYLIPQWRGKGIGSMLIEALVKVAEKIALPKMIIDALLPSEEADERRLIAEHLAQKLGLQKESVDKVSVVKVPLAIDLVEDLNLEVDEALGKYRLLMWEDSIPEDYLEQFVNLLNEFEAEIPREASSQEKITYTPERIREIEANLLKSNRHFIISAALSPSGKIVGMSKMVYRDNGSTLASQEQTFVLADHRGHRLGLGMKLATHRMVHELAPDIAYISTYNNHTNDTMLKINQRLGYFESSECIEYCVDLKKLLKNSNS